MALRKRGIRFFPITIGPMRMLTRRGMALKAKLRRANPGTRVFEVYPGATFDIFGIPRKDARRILTWARRFVRLRVKRYTQDELDSIAAAITMKLHICGESEALGSTSEGLIIVPRMPAAAAGMKR